METSSALLVFCGGNSLVTGEFPSHRPVTWSFDGFFDLRLNKWLSKQLRCQWFEMPSCSLWCHCNVSFALNQSLSPIVICYWAVLPLSFRITSLQLRAILPMPDRLIASATSLKGIDKYPQTTNIKCTRSQNLNDPHLILQLSLPNSLKPGVKLRMKM